MGKKRYREERILWILLESESGLKMGDLVRKVVFPALLLFLCGSLLLPSCFGGTDPHDLGDFIEDSHAQLVELHTRNLLWRGLGASIKDPEDILKPRFDPFRHDLWVFLQAHLVSTDSLPEEGPARTDLLNQFMDRVFGIAFRDWDWKILWTGQWQGKKAARVQVHLGLIADQVRDYGFYLFDTPQGWRFAPVVLQLTNVQDFARQFFLDPLGQDCRRALVELGLSAEDLEAVELPEQIPSGVLDSFRQVLGPRLVESVALPKQDPERRAFLWLWILAHSDLERDWKGVMPPDSPTRPLSLEDFGTGWRIRFSVNPKNDSIPYEILLSHGFDGWHILELKP